MIDQATVDKIFDAANVEEVVGEFVELRKRGVNQIGCCPFHNEKTPSFTVSAAKGIYKCFGCGEGGNAINFVMKHERMSFVEALRFLAKKYHIEIEEKEESPEEVERRKKREGQQILLNRAKTFFVDQLYKTNVGTQQVLPYFEQQGFRQILLEKFEVGFTGVSHDGFVTQVLSEGYKKEAVLTSGLALLDENNLVDRFKRRIVFPIFTSSGRICSFYGRKSKEEPNEPIHLYGESNGLFNPEREMFGFYQAKNSIVKLKNCYVVDYPMEVLSLHLSGIENGISLFEEMISEQQIKAMLRFTSSLCFFGQESEYVFYKLLPNIRACLRGGFSLKIAVLPHNESIESFLSGRSATDVEIYLEQKSIDWLKYASTILSKASINDNEKRLESMKALVGLIAQIPNSIVRGVYISEMANHFQVDEGILNNELRHQLR